MGREKLQDTPNRFINIIGLVFVAPLLILKLIGDIIISVGKFSLDFIYTTYKKIITLFCKINLKSISFVIPSDTRWSRGISELVSDIFSHLREIPHGVYTELVECVRNDILTLQRDINLKLPHPQKKIVFSYRKFPRINFNFPKLPKSPVLPVFFFTKTKYFFFGAFTVFSIVAIIQINRLVYSLPNPSFLTLRDIAATTKIYDRNGKLLYEIYADENRTPIKLSEIPKIVKDATIAIEDNEFLTHQGISLRGSLRALYHNLTSDSIEGGSTITQQLVRSALLTPERTLTRKIKEIILSVWAEHVFTKEQILEMYLNQVPYGGTAWGIEAASETYFGKNAGKLDLAEAAFLSGLPASPSRFSPYGTHPELAKARQEEVLKRMVDLGIIKEKDAQEAKEEVLNIRKQTIPISAPHFVMYIKDLLEQQYGPRLVERGGLRITTSLDLSIQEMAQKAVSQQIENLKSLNVGNGAALITNPQNGEILAMVGSANYFDRENSGNVNLTTALRQPGSSIKVVNYAAALSSGFSTASILDDSPISFKFAGSPTYTPVNYDGKFHGKIPLRVALASSYNIPAVKVLAAIGVSRMIEQGKLMGIESWNEENRFGLSLTLGGGEVTMLDLSKVYATLATGGVRHSLTPILKITNWRGEDLSTPILQESIRAISDEIAFILSSILSDNNARSPAFGSNSSLVIPGKTVAVKTGTSDSKRDNWTIGFTSDYVAAVWVGNNDNTPMNPSLTSGVTGAAPIWNEIMTNLLKDKPDKPFLPAKNIVSLPCFGRTEYFIIGTEPKGGCPRLVTPTPTPKQ